MRSDRERLLDILEAIEKIEQHALISRDAFDENELIQVWVVHHLQIIGEAVYQISPEMLEQYSYVPWNNIIGMRHILVHGYFETDIDIVWNVLQNEL